MNGIIIRVQNQTGSLFDFTVAPGTELKTTISAIENGDIGELFGAGTQEFILAPTNQTDENGVLSGNTVEDFFGNLDLAGSVAKVDITHYYPASIMNDGVEIFRGKLYFKSVITDNKGYNQYKVVIINQSVSLKQELEKITVSALDWTKYNHILTLQNITGSWDNALYNGDIKYPSVNYGMNTQDPNCPQYAFYGGSALNFNTKKSNTFDNYKKPLRVIDFKPAVRAKAVIDTIFSGSSFNYTSSFFASDYFNNIYILPSSTNTLGPVAEEPAANFLTAQYSGSSLILLPNQSASFKPDEVIADQGGFYTTVSGLYQVPNTGWYSVIGNLGWYMRNPNNNLGFNPYVQVDVLINGTSSYTARKQGVAPTSSLSFNATRYLIGGDYISTQVSYFDSAPLSTRTIEFSNLNNTPNNLRAPGISWYKIFSNQGLVPPIVNMGKQFAADMTGYDILRGLAQKFNLVFEPDVDDRRTIRIEPYQDWMSAGANVDWTNKVDMSQKFEITHPAAEQPKRIVFSDVDDNDFYNKDAKSKNPFAFNFGTYVFQADNDISDGEKKIGTTFAPTPVAGIPNGPNYIIPHLCAQDSNGQQTPIQFKPRLLYDNGKKPVSAEAKGIDELGNINPGKYWILNQATNLPVSMSNFYQMNTMTSMPVSFYGGKDLHYSGFYWVPYVTAPILSQTPFGAYLNYWGSYLNELYDDDARKLVCSVYLTPLEVSTLRLNSKYFIMGNYWRINKISNANLLKPSVIEIEFIKVPQRITTQPSRRTTPGTGPNDPAARPPIRISNFLEDGTVTYEHAVTGEPITSGSLLEIAAPKDGFIVSGSGNSVGIATWKKDTIFPNTGMFAQTVVGSNVVTNESNRTSVIGGANEVKAELDNLLLVGDENTIYENSSGVTILNSSENDVGTNSGVSNVTIVNGVGNEILSTATIDYAQSLETNDVILLNVSGSIVDSATNTNFIGRFNATENLAPNKVSSVYTDFTTLPEYYGMNVMASTGLEEAYWFNAKPYIINASGSYTENLNTKQGRNKYVFYIKRSGATGTTTINLDDIDGTSNNFPSQGRALIFYTDENVSADNPVVIQRGGTDTFKPSPAGAATSITLDEPMQVCEIHAVYDTAAGQAWWQVIRRTTEQRRNSYLSAIATTKYCTAEANECFNIAWQAELNRYNIVVDGGDTTVIRFQYAGMYSVNFSATAELPAGANSGDVTIGLALNGDEIQYTAYTTHIHKKEEYFSLSHHWLVYITNPTSDQLQVRFFASANGTCITGGDHLPESDCHEWPAAAINISYVGGGYGIDS